MVNGDDTQVPYPIQSPHEHSNISFRGNKNGNGQKLGAMNIGECTQDPDGASSSSVLELEPCAIVGDIPNITKHRKKNIPDTVQWERVHSKDYNRCIYQNKARNDLLVYTGKEVGWGNVPNIVEAHALIRRSGLPNFLHIPVHSQLNIPMWKQYLHTYWDQQLVDLLQYGFPLDFDRSRQLQVTKINHKSAIDYQDHGSTYIEEELKYGAIYGPFDKKPFSCHVSPFLTRHKPNSDNRRVIVDLS